MTGSPRAQDKRSIILLRAMRNIVILTGAGVSAESGIDTFRGAGGLWEQHRVEDVATPEAFARDPDPVHRFYHAPRAATPAKPPNAAPEAHARPTATSPPAPPTSSTASTTHGVRRSRRRRRTPRTKRSPGSMQRGPARC